MSTSPFPGPVARLLHAALDRLSLHHIAHQAARRGYVLCDEDDGLGDPPWDLDTDEFHEAEACFRCGDTEGALVWLERALPAAFAGLADRVQPRTAPPPSLPRAERPS